MLKKGAPSTKYKCLANVPFEWTMLMQPTPCMQQQQLKQEMKVASLASNNVIHMDKLIFCFVFCLGTNNACRFNHFQLLIYQICLTDYFSRL